MLTCWLHHNTQNDLDLSFYPVLIPYLILFSVKVWFTNQGLFATFVYNDHEISWISFPWNGRYNKTDAIYYLFKSTYANDWPIKMSQDRECLLITSKINNQLSLIFPMELKADNIIQSLIDWRIILTNLVFQIRIYLGMFIALSVFQTLKNHKRCN